MSNATIKLITAILAAASFTACGDNTSRSAQSVYDAASSLLEQGNPAGAITMLDSLDSAYPAETSLRRRGMHLRALALEKLTVAELAETDSLLACLTAESQQLSTSLRKVDNAVEPYFIAAGSTLAPTGLQARMAPDGVIYIVSSLSGHPLRHTSITASAGGRTASTATVAFDGERSSRNGGVETVHFVGAECDSLIRFITSADSPVTITWNGTSGYSRPLTASEQKAIATLGSYAASVTAVKVATLEHQRLEKRLEIARSQAARTYPDSIR